MPYLDLYDDETLLQLLQRFLAAHPGERARHDAARARAGEPEGYFLCQASTMAMARWAR